MWNESFFSAPQLKRDPLGSVIGLQSARVRPQMGFVVRRRTASWLAALTGFLSIWTLACALPPPSDQELVLQFTRDSANYERVMAMFAVDTNIGMITSKLLWSVEQRDGNASAAQVGITESRLAEYRRVLDSLRVMHVARWAPDGVMFTTWAAGWGNRHHRGIAWLSKPTPRIVYRRFSVIKAPWYIFDD